jgi:hypothetical protein
MGTVRIERRFRGPEMTGNGGYVAGLVAAALGGSNCTVTLKSPPPLDRDLTLATKDAVATLSADDSVVVTAAREPVDIQVPPPPSLETAEDAEPRFTGLSHHVFSGCFVCGPERDSGDGMRIFPGALGDPAHQVAATWEPDETLADADGLVRPESCGRRSTAPAISQSSSRRGWRCLARWRRRSTGRCGRATDWLSPDGQSRARGASTALAARYTMHRVSWSQQRPRHG